jgi:ribonuclease BN (tRNA processing enzyme)
VRITLLPSSVFQQDGHLQFLTSLLIDDAVVIDAGSIGFFGDLHTQARVRHVFISHTHIDHVASLPILLDNIVGLNDPPVTVYGSPAVRASLQSDVFNGRLWPDFFTITSGSKPFLHFELLQSGQTVSVEGLRITPVDVDHAVPTQGFIIESGSTAIVISSDTGPTDGIWKRAAKLPNLRAVFLEATFPAELGRLGEISKHLTTATFAQEVRKLKPDVPLFALHLKARHDEQVRAELQALGLPNLQVTVPGKVYEF